MLGFDFAKAAELKRYERDFEEIEKVGSGGFSTVYKVKNKLDKRCYALKIIKIKPSLYKSDIYQQFQRLLNETKILASFSHPNIVKYYGCWMEAVQSTCNQQAPEEPNHPSQSEFEMVIYDDQSNSGIEFALNSGSANENKEIENKISKSTNASDCLFNSALKHYLEIKIYIQTELCDCSLQHYVEQRNIKIKNSQINIRQYFAENYRIALDIIRGLNYIHSRKVIHRDLKLQNVIMDSGGRCKIIDFGLAKKVRNMSSVNVDMYSQKQNAQLTEEEIEKYSSSVGTKIFSSPQQSSSNKYDYRTDIFSLGMVIAVLFTTFITVHGERELLLNIRDKNLASIEIDSSLKDLLIRCLSEQKLRPSLFELEECIKKLLREEFNETQRKKRNCGIESKKDQQAKIPAKINRFDECL